MMMIVMTSSEEDRDECRSHVLHTMSTLDSMAVPLVS